MSTIPLSNLSFMLIPLGMVWFIYYKWTGDKKEIIYATLRMLSQLLIIGYLLVYIFQEEKAYVGAMILTFMLLAASLITLRNTNDKSRKHYSIILTAITISGVFHLFFVVYLVLDIRHFYEPKYVIPIAGMVFANTMNAVSLCIDRFEKEITRSSFLEARNMAFKSSLIPQINSLLAVGLVSLPGMMTGQIISGVDPLIAVRYQIMIMAMTLSTAGISVFLYLLLKQRSL